MRRRGAMVGAADVLAMVGAALATLGLGMIYLPLAPLGLGLLLLLLGLLGSVAGPRAG
jgi:hypothetical protein